MRIYRMFIFSGLLFLSLPGTSWANCNSEALKEFQEFSLIKLDGDLSAKSGNWPEAEQKYKKQLSALPDQGAGRIVALRRLSSALLKQKKFKQVLPHIGQADRELKEQFGGDHIYRMELTNTAATAAYYLGKMQESRKMVQDALQMLRINSQLLNKSAKAWSKDNEGSQRHRLSGVNLPKAIGGYPLKSLKTFSLDCTDVAAGFGSKDIHFNVYLTRAGSVETVNANLMGALEAIKTRIGNAKVTDQGPIKSLTSRMPNNGRFAVVNYTGPKDGKDYVSAVYLVQAGPWTVKVRSTYLRELIPEANVALEELWKNMTWPKS